VGDYVHGSDSDEEEAVLAQMKAISEAEAHARFRREEADTVRQVREYEAASSVKLEFSSLSSNFQA
jgi:hypothetical protein